MQHPGQRIVRLVEAFLGAEDQPGQPGARRRRPGVEPGELLGGADARPERRLQRRVRLQVDRHRADRAGGLAGERRHREAGGGGVGDAADDALRPDRRPVGAARHRRRPAHPELGHGMARRHPPGGELPPPPVHRRRHRRRFLGHEPVRGGARVGRGDRDVGREQGAGHGPQPGGRVGSRHGAIPAGWRAARGAATSPRRGLAPSRRAPRRRAPPPGASAGRRDARRAPRASGSGRCR